MTYTIKHRGIVKGGKFIPDQPEAFKSSFYGLENKRVVVTVGKERKDRSLEENRYYWGVVVEMIADAMGDSDRLHIHEQLKTLFLTVIEFVEIKTGAMKGKMLKIQYVRSSADLTTIEFERFLDEIREWAVKEMALLIPLPNEIELN